MSGAPKASLFGVPKDRKLREEWQRNLHKADKPLDETGAVYELHFESRLVIRECVDTPWKEHAGC